MSIDYRAAQFQTLLHGTSIQDSNKRGVRKENRARKE